LNYYFSSSTLEQWNCWTTLCKSQWRPRMANAGSYFRSRMPSGYWNGDSRIMQHY